MDIIYDRSSQKDGHVNFETVTQISVLSHVAEIRTNQDSRMHQ